MTVLTVFMQMLALLIMIGAGYYMTKTNMMDEHTNSRMSTMIVRVFNPLLSLASAINSVGQVSQDSLASGGMIAVGMFAFFIVAGRILSPFFGRELQQRKLFQMMFVFSNVGFIGIPVVSSILGAKYVVYVTEFMLVYTLVFYTYGITLMKGRFSLSSLKAMINPGTICGLLAMGIVMFNIEVPGFLKTSFTYLGNVASPMALVSTGFSLAHSDLQKVFRQTRLYLFSAVKLLILPLIMLPLLRLAAPSADLIPVCMIMFGMPAGNMPLILATQEGIDGSVCSAAIILTTILCVFTVPVLLAVV